MQRKYIPIALALFLSGCPTTNDGYIEGSVAPPGHNISVSASSTDRPIQTIMPDGRDGRFRFTVAPGTYDVSITAPASPFPLVLSGVVVRPRETTPLGVIQLALPPEGTASIRGRIKAAPSDAVITLMSEGIERASVHPDAQGTYLIERLLPGPYMLKVQAPGYANDTVQITLQEGRQSKQDIRQLYITTIEGVDWGSGMLQARGVGLPPAQSPTPSVRREMAKRAALTDAERNLLRAIDLLQVGPDQKLSELIGEEAFTQRLQGIVSGYRITADRDLDGGRVEIEIEVPLTGPSGITTLIHDR